MHGAGPRVSWLSAGTNPAHLASFGLLACALDESAEITNREIEGEVDGGEQLHKEEVPPQETHDEGQTTGCVLQVGGGDAFGGLPEKAGETAEGGDEEGEDHQEDDVGAEGADHVDEAEDAHVQLEVGKGCGEDWVAGAGGWVGGVIGD